MTGDNGTGKDEKCSACKFYVEQKEEQGYCHRFPPTATVLLMPRPSLNPREVKMDRIELSVIPTAMANSWCGEWKERE